MKYLKISIGVAVTMSLAIIAIGALQAPEAAITVRAISHQDIHEANDDGFPIDTTKYKSPSTGLRVVGKGELVYLSARESGGEAVDTYAWTLTGPAGSAATLDATDTELVTFRPDVTGTFQVQVGITTASGTVSSSVAITSAEYVGVGTMVPGVSPDIIAGQCGVCHPGNSASWKDTRHASKFERAIDLVQNDEFGISHGFYAESCIECHTVGFDEDPAAVNGGFDDVATDLGWTFPTPGPGNWNDIVTNFPALAQKASIQCESCHGPGSEHKGDVTKIDLTLEEGLCGRCHDELNYHENNLEWKRSGHSVGVGFAAGRSGCADCHSGYGFIAKVDPVSDLDQKVGFPQISCAVCHDPHDVENKRQLRRIDDVTLGDGTVINKGGMGKLCMNCHIGRRDAIEYAQTAQGHFGPHYSNQADMLFGTNVITWGMYVPSSTHRDALENTCVSCHMFDTPAAGDPGRHFVGEHTFAMHATDDGGTPNDPSDDVMVDNVASCARCHGENLTSFDDIPAREDFDEDGAIESAKAELAGTMERVALLLPPIGDPAVQEDPDETYTKLQLNALFNYHYVVDDGSHGMHNFQFAVNLMKLTENALMFGVLVEGEVESVTDVANDQGKQVRIVWTRFGGDGVSDNPVGNYGLWRRVDDVANSTAKRSAPAYTSFNIGAEEVAAFGEGTQVLVNDVLWDFVGSVTAASLDKYSAIAPTLVDSTQAGGTQWSVFMVTGHTQIPAIYAATVPDSGYSIDNLSPVAPSNLAGMETSAGVELTWDDPIDSDFSSFAVYRSTTQGFDPTGTEPLAEVTQAAFTDQDVAIGTTYFYRLSARDFSGNESVFSEEFSFLVVSVDDSRISAIPEDYFLDQNYPNPFNPTTTINFGLKEPGKVTVVIYNALGEEIATVLDSQMGAGNHRAVISAETLSTGIYFYQIRVNNFKAVKKMIVMK